MPLFHYQGVDAAGKPVTGELDVASQQAALTALAERGIVPHDLTDGAGAAALRWWQKDVALFGTRRPTADLIRFFGAFAVVLEANIPLAKAFGFAERQVRSKRLNAALTAAYADLTNGALLSVAMGKHEEMFGKQTIAMIQIGEMSNTLAVSVRACEQALKSAEEVRTEIRNALIYPVILLLMSAAVLGIILFYLLPTLEPVFQSTGAEVPLAFVIMTALRDGALTYWPVLGLAACFAIVGFPLLQRLGLVGRMLDRMWFIGALRRDIQSQSAAQTVSVMLQSGASLPEALELAAEATSSRRFSSFLSDARDQVVGGAPLSAALSPSDQISSVVSEMVEIGEESDRLAELLASAGLSLEHAIKERIGLALKMVTPILTLLIGLIVGGMVLSTISAVMDINDIAL